MAINRLVHGRTTIAIAHRLATLRNADRLIVFDDGKVAEMGSHDELIVNGGIYQKLVETQTELSHITAVGG
jgi:ATP-binding cassette subfamily B protein